MTVTDGLTHSPRAVLDPRRSAAESARPDSTYGPMPVMLLLLTAFTGVVDAVSILALGRVFVANMTGNVVFVGFALTGAPGFSLVASLVGLAGFLIGARAGGHLIRRVGDDHGTLFATGSSFELVLVVATFVLVVSAGTGSPTVRDLAVALLAVTTGIQNAVVRRLAVPDLTTTVLTMTLTGIASDTGNARAARLRRLLAVLAMLVGAIAGAELVQQVEVAAALGLATLLIFTVTVGARYTLRPAGSGRHVAARRG